MAAGLPQVGKIVYNGFTFSVHAETTSFQVRPQYDPTGRTVVYNVYTIVIKDILHSINGSDDLFEDARRRLTKPGAPFQYQNRGAGNIQINVGGIKDVLWGPKPQLLTWTPIGRNLTCEFTWQVEVAIPDCAQARYELAPMEFVYTIAIDIDSSGYTRRTYSGHLRIPLTRVNAESNQLADNADRYWERVVPLLPPGFRRVSQSRSLDESKTKLTFTIVDEELHGPAPPPGIIAVEASHQVNSQNRALANWSATIQASYEVMRGIPTLRAYEAFARLLADRIAHTRAHAKFDQKGTQTIIVPVSMTLQEPNLYGKSICNFSFTYTFACSKELIFKASGLWQPVPSAGWGAWAAMMALGPHHPRGYARLVFDSGDDRLLDLCQPERRELASWRPPTGSGSVAGAGLPATLQGLYSTTMRGDPIADVINTLNSTANPALASWIDYTNTIYLEMQDATVTSRSLSSSPLNIRTLNSSGRGLESVQATLLSGIKQGSARRGAPGNDNLFTPKPLPTVPPAPVIPPIRVPDWQPAPANVGPAGVPDFIQAGFQDTIQKINQNIPQWQALAQQKPKPPGMPPPAPPPQAAVAAAAPAVQQAQRPAPPTVTVQPRAETVCHLIMRGRAIRIGFPIQPPSLVSVDGMTPVPANREGNGFKQTIVSTNHGVYYVAEWSLRYALPRVPRKTPLVPTLVGGQVYA